MNEAPTVSFMDVCCWDTAPSAVMEGFALWERDTGANAHTSCMHIFHLENVCKDTVCYTVSLAQEGETDGEIV